MKSLLTVGLALGLLSFSSIVQASSPASSVEASISAARAEGKAVVVAFHSPSCGSCKVQKPALEALLKTGEFKNVQSYLLDFGSSQELRAKLRVRSPSTILVYKGNDELVRSIGETNPAQIEALLRKAL